MFVNTFIRRPILASVCSLVIILAGAIAIPTMPVAQYPALAPPQISVSAIYTGANAQEVESAVTTPLEQSINGVEGMLYMTSSSTNSGASSITVTFDITRDQDLAQVDVQNRVSQALGRLPPTSARSGSRCRSRTPASSWPPACSPSTANTIRCFSATTSTSTSRTRSSASPASADVTIFGERRYSMRLWLDPQKLAARQITAGDVTNALQQQNAQVAAGALGQAPAPAGQMYQFSVRVEGRLTEVAEFDNLIVKAGANGSLVRLKDVGHASSAPKPMPRRCGSRDTTRSASASSSSPRRTRSTSRAMSGRFSRVCRFASRPASSTRSPSIPLRSSTTRSAKC